MEFETSIDSIDYTLCNLDISVAVVDRESEEVDAEFLEAISEIEGKKSFPCPKCTKICKSKGGLAKHTNSKHRDAVDLQNKTQQNLPNRKRVCQKRI